MPFTAKAGTQVNAFFEASTAVKGSIILSVDNFFTTNQVFDEAGHCTFNIPSKSGGNSSQISYQVEIDLGTAPISLKLTLKQGGTALAATGGDSNPTTISGLTIGVNPAGGDHNFVLNFA